MPTNIKTIHNYTKYGFQSDNNSYTGAVGDFVLVLDSEATRLAKTVYVHDGIRKGGLHLCSELESYQNIKNYNDNVVRDEYFKRRGRITEEVITVRNPDGTTLDTVSYAYSTDNTILTNVVVGTQETIGTDKGRYSVTVYGPDNGLALDVKTGNTNLAKNLTVGGNTNIGGDTVINKTLTVKDKSTFGENGNTVIAKNGNVTVGSSTNPASIIVNYTGEGVTGNALTVNGKSNLKGNTTIIGDTTVSGNEYITGTLNVGGTSSGASTVTIQSKTVDNKNYFLTTNKELTLPSTEALSENATLQSGLLTLGWLQKVLTNNGENITGDWSLLDGIFTDDANAFSKWIFGKEDTFIKELADAVVSNEKINNAIGNAISTAIDKDVTIANKLKASLDISIPLTGKDIDSIHYKKKYANATDFKDKVDAINTKIAAAIKANPKIDVKTITTEDEKKILNEWDLYQNMSSSEKSNFLKFTYIQDDENSIKIKRDYIWFVCGGAEVDTSKNTNIVGNDNPSYQVLINNGLLNPATLSDKIKSSLGSAATDAYLVSCNWGKTPRTAFKTVKRATSFVAQHFKFNDQTARILIKSNTDASGAVAEYKPDSISIGGLDSTNGKLRIEPLSFTTVSYTPESATNETTVAKIYDLYNIKKNKTVEINRVDGTIKYVPLIDFCGVDIRLKENVSEPTLKQGILTVKSDAITQEEYQSAIDLAGTAGHAYRSTQANIFTRLHNIEYSKYRKKYWLYDDVIIHQTTRSNNETMRFSHSEYDLYNLSIKLTLLSKTDQTVTHWNRVLVATLGANVDVRCCDFETIFNTHDYGLDLDNGGTSVTQNYVHEMICSTGNASIDLQFYNSFKITHLECASYMDIRAMDKTKDDAAKWLQVYNHVYGTSYSGFSLGAKLPNGDIVGIVYKDDPNVRFLSTAENGNIFFANQATCIQGRHTYFSGESRYFCVNQTGGQIRQAWDGRYKKILRVPENEKLYVHQMYYNSRNVTLQLETWCDLQGVKNTDGTWVRCFQSWGKVFPDVDGAAPITDCALPGNQKYIDLGIDVWDENSISKTNPYNNTSGIDCFMESSNVKTMYPNYEPILSYDKIKTFINNTIN